MFFRTLKFSFSIFHRARPQAARSTTVSGANLEVGDEAVAVGDGAGGVDDLDHEPVDGQGVGIAAQRDVAQPAVAVVETLAPPLDCAGQRREIDAGEVFLDRLMGRRLAHEQEVSVHRPHRLADRLAGEQVIAEIDRLQPGIAPAMALQPAPDRPAFTVLLLVTVLRHDEFRLQRHHPVVVGRHDRRRHQRVEVFGLVLAPLAARALLAMNLARRVIFGAVQGDQHMIPKPAKVLQAAGTLQFGHHLGEDRMEVVGADRVPQRPDMIVAGDPIQAEQRLAVRPALSLLQTTLMRQERRSCRKNRENADKPISAIV